jgi:prepilin-type processing-associated H-X9-DG protein/prepilin-type N-terminal cleavage/methylation domain-containing protein
MKTDQINGFTLIEILVCIGIIALLCAILFPVFINAKNKSYSATCITHLKQASQSVMMYTNDNDGSFPGLVAWQLWSATHNDTIPFCPLISNKNLKENNYEGFSGRHYEGVPGYALNADLISYNTSTISSINIRECRISDISYISNTVMLCEESPKILIALGPDPYKFTAPYPFGIKKEWERHSGGANYVFCDGHVKWYKPEAVSPANYPLDTNEKNTGNDGVHPSFMKLSSEDIIPYQ